VSRIFRLGLGGRLGAGTQWLSWIALDDLVRLIIRAIDDELLHGPLNVTSAVPVTNAVFTDSLARVLHRAAVMPAPAFALRAVFGSMADDVLLGSQRVRPARLLALGFSFEHASIDDALRAAVT
jgi:NAD dependent epimerase/dehydratase family enzyme